MYRDNNDWESYKVSIQRNTDSNKRYTGNVRVHKRNVKKTKRPKMVSVPLVAVIVSIPLALSGAKTIADGIVNKTASMVENVKVSYYTTQEYHKDVAYTDLSDREIERLDFEDRIQLYDNYILYVSENAPDLSNRPIPPQYPKLRSQAAYLRQELNNYPYDGEYAKELRSTIYDKYYEAMSEIDELYGGKYSLNNITENTRVISSSDLEQSVRNL